MSTAIHKLVAACRAEAEATLIARMCSGWAVMGRTQVLTGYCLLLPDPVVPHLNALTGTARSAFLDDLTRLGDAVLELTGALRINYAVFGNLEPALHAHVFPRYADEPENLRSANPWAYDWNKAPTFQPAQHGRLLQQLRERLGSPG